MFFSNWWFRKGNFFILRVCDECPLEGGALAVTSHQKGLKMLDRSFCQSVFLVLFKGDSHVKTPCNFLFELYMIFMTAYLEPLSKKKGFVPKGYTGATPESYHGFLKLMVLEKDNFLSTIFRGFNRCPAVSFRGSTIDYRHYPP